MTRRPLPRRSWRGHKSMQAVASHSCSLWALPRPQEGWSRRCRSTTKACLLTGLAIALFSFHQSMDLRDPELHAVVRSMDVPEATFVSSARQLRRRQTSRRTEAIRRSPPFADADDENWRNITSSNDWLSGTSHYQSPRDLPTGNGGQVNETSTPTKWNVAADTLGSKKCEECDIIG